MNRNAQELQAVERAETELVDDISTFFAPTSSDLIDSLLGQYAVAKRNIESLGNALKGDELGGAMHYFLEASELRGGMRMSMSGLADTAAALSVLDASFWSKALGLTDVLDVMPQSRRDEWNKAISERKTVPFTEDAVRPTIRDLLASRQKFFTERIDGIFRGLSGTHVTNAPEGFRRRMIMSGVLDEWANPRSERAGLINDLRSVIATFVGRPGLRHYETSELLRRLAKSRDAFGVWHELDGGALRIRLYRGVGTAHLEVNLELAHRLNGVLASLYPSAIPAKFRTKPTSKSKTFQLMERPLPFAVLRILDAGSIGASVPGTWSFSFGYGRDESKAARTEAERVLEALGGSPVKYGFAFDFDPREVILRVLTSGCIPDTVSHQFYPTPESVATAAYEMLEAGPDDTFLEPSAGLGALAQLLPPERTTCVEISSLRCAVLRARGYNVHEGDFIAWAAAQRSTTTRYSRVLQNPPFEGGRALAHLREAASLVQSGGRIVAILPASTRGKELLPDWVGEWSGVFSNEFAGTSVSVAIYAATRP